MRPPALDVDDRADFSGLIDAGLSNPPKAIAARSLTQRRQHCDDQDPSDKQDLRHPSLPLSANCGLICAMWSQLTQG